MIEPPANEASVTIDQLIRAQVRLTPDAIAAVMDAQSLTYAELDARSDNAANHLRQRGIGRGSLVGLHIERSLEMLVVLIAVMKAGGAYVPLDPDFPAERLAFMASDARLAMIVSDAAEPGLAPPAGCAMMGLHELLGVEVDAGVAPAVQTGECDLVYVLYTSGSTGAPKGVALEHRNVINFLRSMQREPGLSPGDRLLAVTTLSFDIAALELLLPLVTGATVVIAGRDDAMDGVRLRSLIDAQSINVMQATPTTWRLLLEAGWAGKRQFKALCGGEALPRDLAGGLVRRCGALWNMYGPTETAIWSTLFRVVDGDAPILIGRPIANTRVYVLDRSGHPVPTGIPGEIFIGGAGVARGYLHRPELTAEKFVHDPFCDEFGSRMYRTGDVGRFLVDGNLEFRHRIDQQVKIRGFRVELGEVEGALQSHAAVGQAIARLWELAPGDMELAAYVVAATGEECMATALREYLRERLPRYMLPRHIIMLGAMPLLPNGKIDRHALPRPVVDPRAVERALASAADEPDPRVRYLSGVWAELLGTPAGPQDNFFDLGGHSMLAVQMANRVARDTGVRIKLIRLGAETLAQCAADLPLSMDLQPATSAGAGATIGGGLRRLLSLVATESKP